MAIIAPALAARGHEVHVLSCMVDQRCRDYVEEGVHVHRRDQVQLRGMGRVARRLGANLTIFRVTSGISNFLESLRLGGDFDVIEFPDANAEGWPFVFFRERPTVAHLHSPTAIWGRHYGLPFDRDFRWTSSLEQYAVRNADMVTSPSDLLLRELRDIGWLRETNPEVVPHPIDWRRWVDCCPVSAAPENILFLGRIEQLKAPEVVVEALDIVRKSRPQARAMLVGRSRGTRDGLPYIEWLKRSARDVNGCDFIGPVSRQELPRVFSASRVLAMTSWFENFPMVVLEAMAAGRPIVATSRVGTNELIKTAGCGVIIPPGDPSALAEALVPILQDGNHASEIGEKGRAFVREKLDPDKIAATREDVYRRTIASFVRRVRSQGRLRLVMGHALYPLIRRCLQAWANLSQRVPDPDGAYLRERSRGFPHVMPKQIGRLSIPAGWREWAVMEAVKWPGYHFYLHTANQLLGLLTRHPAFSHRTSLDGVRALDVGCTPAVSVLLACLGAETVLLDTCSDELRKGQHYARLLGVEDRIRVVRADAFEMPFKPGSFDIAWNSGFIEHFAHPEQIVQGMARTVRVDGTLVFLVPNRWTPHSLFIRPLLRRRSEGYHWDWMGRERSYTKSEMGRLVRDAGLEIVVSSTGNLRRSVCDDSVIMERLSRIRRRELLFRLINLLDWLECCVPPLRVFGFMVGVAATTRGGIREKRAA